MSDFKLNDYKISGNYGMQIPVNSPEFSFDLSTITHKIMVEHAKNVEEAIKNGIIDIARASGVTTLVLMNDDEIIKALKRHKVERVIRLDGGIQCDCPTCRKPLKTCKEKYCPECGQKLDWSM